MAHFYSNYIKPIATKALGGSLFWMMLRVWMYLIKFETMINYCLQK